MCVEGGVVGDRSRLALDAAEARRRGRLGRRRDVLGGRPTVLWALALATLDETDQQALLATADPSSELTDRQRIAAVKRLYDKAKVFDQATRLVDKHQTRAEEIADEIEPEPLRRLLYHLIDTVLERPSRPAPSLVTLGTK